MNEEKWMLRAVYFELMAKGFLPTAYSTAEALASGEFAEAAIEVARGLRIDLELASEELARYRGRDCDEAYHEVLREYTRLFVRVRKPLITPYAGVRDSQARGKQGLLFIGPETISIEKFMKRCGVAKDLSAGQSNDPVDHIGTMCEFLQFLCLVNARAVAPVEGADVGSADFDVFMSEHFEPYATWCAERIRAVSDVPFYLAMAEMLDISTTFVASS